MPPATKTTAIKERIYLVNLINKSILKAWAKKDPLDLRGVAGLFDREKLIKHAAKEASLRCFFAVKVHGQVVVFAR